MIKTNICGMKMAVSFNSPKRSFEESFQRWLYFFRKNWIYFLGSIFLIASIFYRFSLTNLRNKEALLNSKAIYLKWAQSFDEKSFQKLKELLQKNPSEELSFAPLIANKFLEKEEYEKAKTYAGAFLKRIKKMDSFYYLFSEVSLFIAKKDYKEALAKSLELQQAVEKMEEFSEKYSSLYISNLLRIMFLEKILHHPQKEQKAIEKLESFLNTQKNSSSSKAIQTYLSKQKHFLMLYLADRKQQLKA